MDKAKLIELRQKKVENKSKQHQDILDSNKSIVEAIEQLHKAINDTAQFNKDVLVEQITELRQSNDLKESFSILDDSIKAIKLEQQVIDLESLIQAVNDVKLDNSDVVAAIQSLATKIKNETSQRPEDYLPVRRVRRVGDRYVFDDDPLKVSVVGGGGSGGSSVQQSLVRDTANGKAIAVVNPDGTNIGGGGGGGGDATAAKQDEQTAVLEEIRDNQLPDGHNVTVDNLPTEYPLPTSQVSTLTPQTNALTDAQLRATPLDVDLAGVATEDKQDDTISQLVALRGFQIPEYDEVDISYIGDNISKVEYLSSNVVVATLDLTYSGDNLTNVKLT